MQRIDITNKKIISNEPRGFIKKFWIKDNNTYLVKFNVDIYPDQDVMEYFSSVVHKLNNAETVNVKLINHEEHGTGCMVENFLNEDEVLIEIDSNMILQQSDSVLNNISRALWHVYGKFDSILKISSEELEKLKQDYIKVIFSDCLVENEDRRLRNVGIILNEETQGYRLAPLYDNGLAFSSYPSPREAMVCIANESFYKSDVLNFMFRYNFEDVKDLANNYLNNYDDIVMELNKVSPLLKFEKYEHVLNRLEETKQFISERLNKKDNIKRNM